MPLPPKRYESSKWQRDLNDLIDWATALLTTGGGVPASRSIISGNGLTGGGDLTQDRTLEIGTPTTVTTSSTNSVTADSHTHALTGVEPTVTKGNLTANSTKIAIGGTGTGALIGAGASVDVNEGNLAHNNIGSLQGGQAGEYNHLTNAQVTALHNAVTLAVGSDAALSLTGQELTLANVLTPTEHTNIGNDAPHHAPVTAGDGITVTGQQVALDLADNHTWTGNQLFQGANTYRHLLSEATETYDLGAYNNIWRTGYLSNIMATIFAENTQQLIGGEFIIPKSTGTLPAVASADATIDFGKAMTENDHLLIKSLDTSGVAKTEYIKVGTLVSGTTYNVTRDEAGAHVTDPVWPDGTPYAILGQVGNGYLDFGAVSTPRLSIFTQGANYNDQAEVVRLGDINGLGGIGSTTWGAYFGAANKAYMTVDPTNGMKISTPSSEMLLDKNGITLDFGNVMDDIKSIKWVDGADVITQITSYDKDNTMVSSYIWNKPTAGKDSYITLESAAPTAKKAYAELGAISGDVDIRFHVMSDDSSATRRGVELLKDSTVILNIADDGTVTYNGALKSYKNSTAYTGYIYVPLATPLTSTSWDGDNYTTATDEVLVDANSVFGVPAGAKAIYVRYGIRGAGADIRFSAGPSSGKWTLQGRTQVANIYYESAGIIHLDADTKFYFQVSAANLDIIIVVVGYYI